MKLPRITGDEVVRALKRAGFVTDRQRGSHVILFHPQSRKRVIVPVHTGKIVKLGTLGRDFGRRRTCHRGVYLSPLTFT